MLSKPADIRYCGVNQEKIKHASPVLSVENTMHMSNFIRDRYTVHLKKDIDKLPAPWTDNPVLQNYKFTNVRREHDRQTRYLIKNVARNPNLDTKSKVYNIFLLRSWNNWSTFRAFGGPWHWQDIESPQLKEQVRPIYQGLLAKDPDRKWWSSAYNQGGTKYAWKFPDGNGFSRAPSEAEGRKHADYEPDIPLRVFHLGPWLKQLNMFERLFVCSNQQQVYALIQELRGFSTFLAYQVFVDLTYVKEFPFSENEFTVAGPGCRRGIDLVFTDKGGMSYEECIFWLRDNAHSVFNIDFEDLFRDLRPHDRCLNVMSLENCFCEISKYIKAVNGTGRPKVRYDGRG